MPARRDILKGGIALAAASSATLPHVAQALPGTGPMRFVVDTRLPEAARLTQRARTAGQLPADPRGEIVALLLSAEWAGNTGSIVGLTTWTDFALARDILRSSATPVRHAIALDGPNPGVILGTAGSPAHAALQTLLGPAPRQPGLRATSFLWLA